jgi:hypothetical protein
VGAVGLLGEAVEARSVYLQALRRAPGVGDQAYAAFQTHVLEVMEGLILARAGEVGHRDPEVAVHVGLQAVLGVLEGSEALPLQRRLEEATTLLHAYLGGDGRGQAGPGPVEYFDVWG